ncbi:MAG: RsbRD N-terminal domain-containing protein [Nitrospirae bacterium]|nr:RsbRD N-terminal domain-containing protein [Nitrospirota bacterium]
MDMDLKQQLMEKKPAILKKWFDAVADTYPENTSGFLKKQKAQFTNPVGYTLAEGLDGLFDALLKGMIPDTVKTLLDGIVRIRAIQEFTPSEAVAFIFQLKNIVRQELGNEILHLPGMTDQLAAFDSTIDDLALFAFDIYMKCREKIFELKAKEATNMTFRLLQQARIIVDGQD